eukprot:403674-Amphidinium_carterae.1
MSSSYDISGGPLLFWEELGLAMQPGSFQSNVAQAPWADHDKLTQDHLSNSRCFTYCSSGANFVCTPKCPTHVQAHPYVAFCSELVDHRGSSSSAICSSRL